ncbi:MAG: TetR/AcrR family transcriptional regulator [Caldilineaceae bacterium]
MVKTMDRRVRRSRKMLGEALLALVVEKPFGDITVQDIADRADMNRATFYLHFQSKEELLQSALEELFDELVSHFGEISPEKPIWEDDQSELFVFQHVANHAQLYKALLSDPNLGLVIHQIIAYIARHSERETRKSLSENMSLAIPIELLSHHVAGSLYALIDWWLRNDMPYSPEYMANVAKTLCSDGCTCVVMGEAERVTR